MSKNDLSKTQPGRRPTWFKVLLLLDAFALGGLAVWRLVLTLLENIMQQLITGEAQAEIINVLDHLVPYWLAHTGVLLLLGLLTIGAYVWLRTGSSTVQHTSR
jgi:hypothetical protein